MARIDILNLKPTTISRDLKGKFILLYSAPKVGKTSMAASFPKNLLLATEVGYHALANISAQDITSWSDFKSVLRQLRSDAAKEMFETITIDTVSLLWDLCEKFICQQEGVKTLGDIPYGGGYTLAKKEFSEAMRELSLMGYGIVFITHEEKVNKKNPKTGEEYAYVQPALNKRPFEIINRLVDIIAYISVGFDENEVSVRKVHTRETPTLMAGSRFKFLSSGFDFGYKQLADELYNAIEMEGKMGATIVDTPDRPILVEKRPFHEAMEEAKKIWGECITSAKDDPETMVNKMSAIVQNVFGRPVKLSSVTAVQQDLLELAIDELKALIK